MAMSFDEFDSNINEIINNIQSPYEGHTKLFSLEYKWTREKLAQLRKDIQKKLSSEKRRFLHPKDVQPLIDFLQERQWVINKYNCYTISIKSETTLLLTALAGLLETITGRNRFSLLMPLKNLKSGYTFSSLRDPDEQLRNIVLSDKGDLWIEPVESIIQMEYTGGVLHHTTPKGTGLLKIDFDPLKVIINEHDKLFEKFQAVLGHDNYIAARGERLYYIEKIRENLVQEEALPKKLSRLNAYGKRRSQPTGLNPSIKYSVQLIPLHQGNEELYNELLSYIIENINEPTGCDVDLMPEFPPNPIEYKNNYVFIRKNDNKALYYIKSDGSYENATIVNFNLFEQKINSLKNKNDTKLHLSKEQIQEIITLNGGHTRPTAQMPSKESKENPQTTPKKKFMFSGLKPQVIQGKNESYPEKLLKFDNENKRLYQQFYSHFKNSTLSKEQIKEPFLFANLGINPSVKSAPYLLNINFDPFSHLLESVLKMEDNIVQFNEQLYDIDLRQLSIKVIEYTPENISLYRQVMSFISDQYKCADAAIVGLVDKLTGRIHECPFSVVNGTPLLEPLSKTEKRRVKYHSASTKTLYDASRALHQAQTQGTSVGNVLHALEETCHRSSSHTYDRWVSMRAQALQIQSVVHKNIGSLNDILDKEVGRQTYAGKEAYEFLEKLTDWLNTLKEEDQRHFFNLKEGNSSTQQIFTHLLRLSNVQFRYSFRNLESINREDYDADTGCSKYFVIVRNCALLKIDSHPGDLINHDLAVKLDHRDGILNYNGELFLADFKTKAVTTLKSAPSLSERIIDEYHVATVEERNLIKEHFGLIYHEDGVFEDYKRLTPQTAYTLVIMDEEYKNNPAFLKKGEVYLNYQDINHIAYTTLETCWNFVLNKQIIVPQKHTIYFNCANQKELSYKLIAENKIIDSNISFEELGITEPIKSARQLEAIRAKILEITTQRGHTKSIAFHTLPGKLKLKNYLGSKAILFASETSPDELLKSKDNEYRNTLRNSIILYKGNYYVIKNFKPYQLDNEGAVKLLSTQFVKGVKNSLNDRATTKYLKNRLDSTYVIATPSDLSNAVQHDSIKILEAIRNQGHLNEEYIKEQLGRIKEIVQAPPDCFPTTFFPLLVNVNVIIHKLLNIPHKIHNECIQEISYKLSYLLSKMPELYSTYYQPKAQNNAVSNVAEINQAEKPTISLLSQAKANALTQLTNALKMATYTVNPPLDRIGFDKECELVSGLARWVDTKERLLELLQLIEYKEPSRLKTYAELIDWNCFDAKVLSTLSTQEIEAFPMLLRNKILGRMLQTIDNLGQYIQSFVYNINFPGFAEILKFCQDKKQIIYFLKYEKITSEEKINRFLPVLREQILACFSTIDEVSHFLQTAPRALNKTLTNFYWSKLVGWIDEGVIDVKNLHNYIFDGEQELELLNEVKQEKITKEFEQVNNIAAFSSLANSYPALTIKFCQDNAHKITPLIGDDKTLTALFQQVANKIIVNRVLEKLGAKMIARCVCDKNIVQLTEIITNSDIINKVFEFLVEGIASKKESRSQVNQLTLFKPENSVSFPHNIFNRCIVSQSILKTIVDKLIFSRSADALQRLISTIDLSAFKWSSLEITAMRKTLCENKFSYLSFATFNLRITLIELEILSGDKSAVHELEFSTLLKDLNPLHKESKSSFPELTYDTNPEELNPASLTL